MHYLFCYDHRGWNIKVIRRVERVDPHVIVRTFHFLRDTDTTNVTYNKQAFDKLNSNNSSRFFNPQQDTLYRYNNNNNNNKPETLSFDKEQQ